MPTLHLLSEDAALADALVPACSAHGLSLHRLGDLKGDGLAHAAASDLLVLEDRALHAAGPASRAALAALPSGCEVALAAHAPAADAVAAAAPLPVAHVLALPLTDRAQAQRLVAQMAERGRLRQELAEVRARLDAEAKLHALALSATHDGLFVYDVAGGQVTYTARWRQQLGIVDEQLTPTASEWLDRVHPEDRDQLREELAVFNEGLVPDLEGEHRVLHRSGTYRTMRLRGRALRDGSGRPVLWVGAHSDVTDQRAEEARREAEALHDPLTGLPGNRLLRERLARAASNAQRREGYLYAVLLLDVDRFKNINDSLGHEEGNQLLRAIGTRLRGCLRAIDMVARLGGDEFTVLLDDVGAREEAIRAVERIQRALTPPFRLREQEVYVTCSIGIAVSTPGQTDSEDLVRDADTAMYRAKSRGSGLYEVFTASMHARAVHRLGIETSLRRALGRQELRLHYQPVVALSDLRLAGFEALIRWHSAERGIVSPLDFIGVAEDTGLILPIGRWVLREACTQMMAWQRAGIAERPLFMSVNISPRQFTQVDLVDQVSNVLRDTGADPKCLKLEITESMLIDNFESTNTMLRRLQAMDVRLCIDDFGTGYSSLSTLSQLPVHTLKIDRSFVNNVHAEDSHGEIVDTIIMLAHNLEMDVIAEGVETVDQLGGLKARGCEYGQGYYFAKPLPEPEATALIASHKHW